MTYLGTGLKPGENERQSIGWNRVVFPDTERDLITNAYLKICLIHTRLQPGGNAFTLLRNRFNGF